MPEGFYRVALGVPLVKVASPRENCRAILDLIREKCQSDAISIMAFPELAASSASCLDLFHDCILLEAVEESIRSLCAETAQYNTLFAVGAPVRCGEKLYNCAVLFHKGSIQGIVPKSFLPNSRQYYEKRYFASGADPEGEEVISFAGQELIPFGKDLIFDAGKDLKIAVEMGEEFLASVSTGNILAMKGATLILNMACGSEEAALGLKRRERVMVRSEESLSVYARVCAGVSESTTDSVCSGHCLAAQGGKLLLDSEKFCRTGKVYTFDCDAGSLRSKRLADPIFRESSEGTFVRTYPCRRKVLSCAVDVPERNSIDLPVSKSPFIPEDPEKRKVYFEELLAIQSSGLAKRMEHTFSKRLVIGISGGLDSTLALLVCCRSLALLGRKNSDILAVTMPGFGTTDRTYQNACNLCRSLGTELREISIAGACREHFRSIGHDEKIHDVTYENSQARERTQILMDLANSVGGLVVGTGDLSEIAMGWCTYNGDHISNYAVNASIPKTLTRSLVLYEASHSPEKVQKLLEDVVNTPVSPELLPPSEDGVIAQKTEDLIGPYEVHDFFLYYFMTEHSSPEKLLFLAEKAFGSEYSRESLVKYLGIFLRRFFTQQFKRNCSTDGPRTGPCGLSGRSDFRMVSDVNWDLWKELMEKESKI